MAVIMSNKQTEVAFFSKLGLEHHQEKLKSLGFEIHFGYSALIIKKVGVMALTIPLDTNIKTIVSTLMPGGMGLSLIKVQVDKSLTEFIAGYTTTEVQEIQPLESMEPVSVKVVKTAHGSKALHVVPTDAPVDLTVATQLYQQVFGTSGGSVYKVAALSEFVKVAVRVQGYKLSIRLVIVGSVSGLVSTLEGWDFTMKHSGTGEYWSTHIDLIHSTAAKTIAAFLAETGVLFYTPLPSKDLI